MAFNYRDFQGQVQRWEGSDVDLLIEAAQQIRVPKGDATGVIIHALGRMVDVNLDADGWCVSEREIAHLDLIALLQV